MGLCVSKINDRFLEHSTGLQTYLNKLGMSNSHAFSFYQVFEKIDRNLSGEIDFTEFAEFFELEETPFCRRAFLVMDVDKRAGGANNLDFGEFLAGIYNYCSMSNQQLQKFAFDLYDEDGSGEIGMDEVQQLIKMIYGNRNFDKKLQTFMNTADRDRDKKVTFQEFSNTCRKQPHLLQPAFALQIRLRECVLGTGYWAKAQRMREGRFNRKIDLLELFYKERTGKRLDRKFADLDADYRKDGWVREEIAEEVLVMEEPREKACVVRTLKAKDEIAIFAEQVDDYDKNVLWYLIDRKEPQWVNSEFIKIDHTWDNPNEESNNVDDDQVEAISPGPGPDTRVYPEGEY